MLSMLIVANIILFLPMDFVHAFKTVGRGPAMLRKHQALSMRYFIIILHITTSLLIKVYVSNLISFNTKFFPKEAVPMSGATEYVVKGGTHLYPTCGWNIDYSITSLN
jgi:hypothetical protein